FRHNWIDEYGDKVGNPFGPGMGEPVVILDKVPPKPASTREVAKLPTNGKDGWFCPFDEVLTLKRTWPDWEFGEPYPKRAPFMNDQGGFVPPAVPPNTPILPALPQPKKARPRRRRPIAWDMGFE